MLICAVCIIVFVMRQHGEEDGLGAISGQTETQDSFYGKNKSKRKESRLKLWTMICGIVIAVLSIAWFVGNCWFDNVPDGRAWFLPFFY